MGPESDQTTACISVFQYLEPLDAFVPAPLYRAVAQDLGLVEWNAVVWIGRFFLLDNDFGEHWFDGADLPDELREVARGMGIDPDEVLILRPEVFQNGRDGPQHTDAARKRFWTDVLCSLCLSLDTLADEARLINEINRVRFPEDFRPDLEERLNHWRARLLAPR
ncbi:hypothetical protein [Deinococcus multiflagellatus]|uniref:Uncharacterized protein n=1 Tax=Deinococcus multiflagellatus TaxID=1656887 RepID=A0ABW1ZLF8_9DEIO|nr:hypothetical protein [Deinococcus multiflagellatus]MBZ9713428.1 hypothetical protein [Deinococcus multiflagellatus]